MSVTSLDFLFRIPWGSNKKSVANGFSEWTSLPPHPTQNAVGFEGEVFGEPAAVVCYFESALFREKLRRINVMWWLERPPDVQVESMFRLVRADLERIHGSAPVEDPDTLDAPPEFRQSAMLFWASPSSVTILSLSLLRDGVSPDAPPLSMTVADRANDPDAQSFAPL